MAKSEFSCPSPRSPRPTAGNDGLVVDDEQLFNVIPDALVTVNDQGLIVRVNRKCLEMFGYDIAELVGSRVEKLMPERIRKTHSIHRREYQRSPSIRHMKAGLDLMGCRKDGTEFPVDIMLSPLSGPITGTIAVIRDITALEEMNKAVTQLAYQDSLTGLRNRAALYRDLDRNIRVSAAEQTHLAIALFDLDRFKEINDTLGHSAGDALLKMVSQRWFKAVREDVQVYRLGGDEFIAVMPDCVGRGCAETLALRLLHALSPPFTLEKQIIYINSSAGVAFAPDDGKSLEELLANADLALYKAKSKGGGCHVFFHDSFRAEAVTRTLLNSRLRQALEEKRFELFYQATVALPSRRIVGAEALLRWRDNGRIIAPSAFIDVLGNSPLSDRVGEWILTEACQTAGRIRESGFPDFRIAVNLFPSQLADPYFPHQVGRIMATAGLEASGLQLEITETIALQESEALLAALQRLRTMGVGLAFDDFGTGYAFLSFLTKMPLTHIKLDRSFVEDLPSSPKYAAIVRALLRMSADLGLGVIAEGVENSQQEEFLRDCECDEAQGFLYACPLPLDEFERLLNVGNNCSRGERELHA